MTAFVGHPADSNCRSVFLQKGGQVFDSGRGAQTERSDAGAQRPESKNLRRAFPSSNQSAAFDENLTPRKRFALVQAVETGASLRSVARRFHVSLATVQHWVARAAKTPLHNVEACADQLRGPKSPSNRTASNLEQQILVAREELKLSALGRLAHVPSGQICKNKISRQRFPACALSADSATLWRARWPSALPASSSAPRLVLAASRPAPSRVG